MALWVGSWSLPCLFSLVSTIRPRCRSTIYPSNSHLVCGIDRECTNLCLFPVPNAGSFPTPFLRVSRPTGFPVTYASLLPGGSSTDTSRFKLRFLKVLHTPLRWTSVFSPEHVFGPWVQIALAEFSPSTNNRLTGTLHIAPVASSVGTVLNEIVIPGKILNHCATISFYIQSTILHVPCSWWTYHRNPTFESTMIPFSCYLGIWISLQSSTGLHWSSRNGLQISCIGCKMQPEGSGNKRL